MTLRTYLLTIFLSLFCLITNATATVRYENFAGGTINVSVSIGHTTELAFPESIAEIVRSQQKDSFSYEVNEKSLFILPKLESKCNLFVRTKSGKSYPVNLDFKDPPDLQVVINDVQSEIAKKTNSPSNVNYSIQLIKTLLKNQDIPGATKEELNEAFFSNDTIRMVILKRYELTNAIAIVAEVENQLYRSIITPVQHISLKNLKAITADSDLLKAKGEEGSKTKIYMIIGK